MVLRNSTIVSTLPIRNGNENIILLLVLADGYTIICEYLTYKEWKHNYNSYYVAEAFIHPVSTLPIRNGNSKP